VGNYPLLALLTYCFHALQTSNVVVSSPMAPRHGFGQPGSRGRCASDDCFSRCTLGGVTWLAEETRPARHTTGWGLTGYTEALGTGAPLALHCPGNRPTQRGRRVGSANRLGSAIGLPTVVGGSDGSPKDGPSPAGGESMDYDGPPWVLAELGSYAFRGPTPGPGTRFCRKNCQLSKTQTSRTTSKNGLYTVIL